MLELGLDGAIYGFGVETGLHLLRIIVSGVFDRFPNLRMVVGHLGEAIPFWLFRLDYMHAANVKAKRYERIKPLRKKISDYMRENVYVTTSGMAWEPAIMFCREVLGADRVLYAMDYPYQYEVDEVVTSDNLPLSLEEKKRFFQTNAETVFASLSATNRPQKSLSEVVMLQTKLLINGADAAAAGGATFDRIDPITGEVATRASAASVADGKAAVAAAAAAFPAWAALGPNARRKHLMAAAAKLREKSPEFASRIMAETGATEGWGHFNVAFAATMLEEAAAMTSQVTGEVIPSDYPGTLAMAIRQPAGVVLGIAPWNAPVILGVRAVALPLACGNTVVLKGSEICPATHRLIGDVFAEAGLPAGVLNVVTHAAKDASAVVEAMIAEPAVRRVNFTGSTRVGRLVAEMAARHLKPVVLELGGKAPLLVLDDADLDEAVKASAFGAFMHQGQICMATERIIVDTAVADDFVARFAKKAKSLAVGNPHNGSFPIAACVDISTVKRVKELIDDAVSKGAVLAAGGTGEGVFFPPTIVDKVTLGHAHLSRRIFWPRCRGHSRQGRRRSGATRERQRIRAFRRRLRARCRPRARRGAAHRFRHLPRERTDRAGRGPDALRRREVERLWTLRRQGRRPRVHRSALDHHRDAAASLSVLTQSHGGENPSRDVG